MARFEFKLPDIGEGVTEGEITAWFIKPGDVIKEDEPMVEIMTDKATVSITSPRAGKITETRGKIGDVVAVHGILVVFDVGGEGADAASGHAGGSANANGNGNASANANASTNGKNSTTKTDDGPAATAVGDIKESLPGTGGFARGPSASGSSGGAGAGAGGGLAFFADKPLATPATRKLARDMNIDLRQVPPTGPQGRVTKTDVEGFAKGGAQTSSPSAASSAEGAAWQAKAFSKADAREPVRITPPQATPGSPAVLEERVPFAGMRRKIARKMAESVHTAAHFTFVEECDASALKELRQKLKVFADKEGVKLSFLPFIVKAVVAALKKTPILNSALDESKDELVYRKYYNIGIATSTDAGLMVPVVKNADRLSILEIAREIDRLSHDAKAGKAKGDDLHGSTFTITSLGAQGGLFATPILNFPEVGILGVHQMKEKPVVKDGQIVIGSVMLLSLSFDHRIVDGHIGAGFAYDVIGYLQEPERLMLTL
jgi:pyruvate dehydrogenase E2 component (dihydrolipoamide acetyltransferase)